MRSVIERACGVYKKQGFPQGAAESLEKLYAMQTNQGVDIKERFYTLERTAVEHVRSDLITKGGETTAEYLDLAKQEYDYDDPRLAQAVKHVVEFCSENNANQYGAKALERLYAERENQSTTTKNSCIATNCRQILYGSRSREWHKDLRKDDTNCGGLTRRSIICCNRLRLWLIFLILQGTELLATNQAQKI